MTSEANDKPRHDDGPAPDGRRDRVQPSDEAKLDKALKDTFPASDPVKPSHPTGADDEPGARIDRKPPPIDKELVEELARDLHRDPKVDG